MLCLCSFHVNLLNKIIQTPLDFNNYLILYYDSEYQKPPYVQELTYTELQNKIKLTLTEEFDAAIKLSQIELETQENKIWNYFISGLEDIKYQVQNKNTIMENIMSIFIKCKHTSYSSIFRISNSKSLF